MQSLSVVATLCLLVLCCRASLLAALTFRQCADEIAKAWLAEYDLRRCAEAKTFAANTNDARRVLKDQTPDERLAAAATALTRLLPAPSAECQSPAVPGLKLSPYHQEDPALPKAWPNWAVRYSYEPS